MADDIGTGATGQVQLRYRDDEPAMEPAVTLDAFVGQSNATAVLIEAGEDVRVLLPYLDRLSLIEVHFARFEDGRGFSDGRILREAGYTGELRASGDILVDWMRHLLRCGFDSFAPDQPIDEEDLAAAFGRFPDVYQDAADDRVPVWNLRHGR